MRSALFIQLALALLLAPHLATAQTFEYDTDRVGGDFDRVQLAFDKPSLCAALCRQNNQCVAFTYTPTGFNGYGQAECWLKDRAPRGWSRDGVVSGLMPERMAARGVPDGASAEGPSLFQAMGRCGQPYDPAVSAECYAQLSIDETDPDVCEALPDEAARRCRGIAGAAIMEKCSTLAELERGVCQRAVAVGYKAPNACDLADPDYIFECKLTVAAELRDPNIILAGSENMDPDDRDRLIAIYATMTKSYDVLEFIRDNRTYDLALTLVSALRVASGEYVEPGICQRLAGGYQSDDGGLGAEAQYRQCQGGLRLAAALSKYADSLSYDELVALNDRLGALFSDPYADDSFLPPELREEIRNARAGAMGQAQSSSPYGGESDPYGGTGGAYTGYGAETAASPPPDTGGYIILEGDSPAPDGLPDNCILGMCSE
jgi:hypothetical protein